MFLMRLIACLLLTAILANAVSADTKALQGPIAIVGHGGMFDANGNEITPSLGFLLDAQMAYKTLLLNQLPASKRKTFGQKMEKLTGNTLSKTDQIHANAEVINQLIKEVAPTNSAQLNSINAFLHNKYGQVLTKDVSTTNSKFVPSPDLSDALKRQGFDLSVAIPKTNLSGQAYMNECRAQGVPTPPDWGSNLWVSRGILSKKFIVTDSVAEVFTFESTTPRGICIALPRYPTGSTTVPTFGIICQGNDSNKACFWDNATGIPLRGSVTPIVSSSFNGGAALYGKGGGVCTDCHAGQNSFVVHPGSPLDRGSILKPTGWVKPLVHPNWPQNPGPTTVLNNITLNAGEGSCLTCHNNTDRFPQLSPTLSAGYCSMVLEAAFKADGTMPPGRSGNTSYLKHVNALRAACNGVTPNPGRNSNNNTNSEACLRSCNQERELCMAEADAGLPGAPRKAQCMMAFRSCEAACSSH